MYFCGYEILFVEIKFVCIKENHHVVPVPVLNSDKAFCGKY